MKTKSNTIISVAAAMLALLSACGERDYTKDSPFDNVVYIDAARVKELNQFTFNNVTETGSRTIAATLALRRPKGCSAWGRGWNSLRRDGSCRGRPETGRLRC